MTKNELKNVIIDELKNQPLGWDVGGYIRDEGAIVVIDGCFNLDKVAEAIINRLNALHLPETEYVVYTDSNCSTPKSVPPDEVALANGDRVHVGDVWYTVTKAGNWNTAVVRLGR